MDDPTLIVAFAGVFGVMSISFFLAARRAKRAHASAIEARAGSALEGMRAQATSFGIGAWWVRERQGERVDIVAYRRIGSRDLALWRRWLFVQVRAGQVERVLCRGRWPLPVVDVQEKTIRMWLVSFARRLGWLGEVEPFTFGDEHWTVSVGHRPTQAESNAMRALAPAATIWARRGVATAAFVGEASLPSSEELEAYVDALRALV